LFLWKLLWGAYIWIWKRPILGAFPAGYLPSLQQGPPPNPRQSWCSLGHPCLISGGWVHLYGHTALFSPSLAQKKENPSFRPWATSEVRAEVIRSPILGSALQLLFYDFFCGGLLDLQTAIQGTLYPWRSLTSASEPTSN
jgi:hypothetical protein